jgi:hypothetical protein
MASLVGCGCIDCTNTKKEYEDLLNKYNECKTSAENNKAWINNKIDYYSKIETERRENESAVLQARLCDYIVPICPKDMTDTGRSIIAKFGSKFDTPEIQKWLIGKIMTLLFGVFIVGVLIRRLWIFMVIPNEKAFQKANSMLASKYEEATELESRTLDVSLKRKTELETSIRELEDKELLTRNQIDLLDDEMAEKEVKSIHLANTISNLENDVVRLRATMDAMKGI